MNIDINLVNKIEYNLNSEKILQEIQNFIENPFIKKIGGFSFQSRLNVDGLASYFESFFDLSDTQNFFSAKIKETDFWLINDNFKGSYIEEIINNFSLVRTRLVIMPPRSCLNFHADPTPRLHIPIKTNNECYFYFPDQCKQFNLKEYNIYSVNTTQKHIFMNTSKQERIHILGSLSQ